MRHEEEWKGCVAHAQEEERQRKSERTIEGATREDVYRCEAQDGGGDRQGMDLDEEESDKEDDGEGSDVGSYDAELDELDECHLGDVAIDRIGPSALPFARDTWRLETPKCENERDSYAFSKVRSLLSFGTFTDSVASHSQARSMPPWPLTPTHCSYGTISLSMPILPACTLRSDIA